MTEPSSSPAVAASVARPPLAPPPSAGGDDDSSLHHHSISDDAPSPSAVAGAAPAPVYTSAKASASAFASKLAFGGRKLLSPLAGVASGSSKDSARASGASDARLTSSSSLKGPASGSAGGGGPTLASSLAGANAVVSDAASVVSSSLSYLFTGGGGGSGAASAASPAATPSSNAPSSATTVDPAELEQMEAEYRQVTAQQRMQILEDLVQYRRADWSYLKAMHQGTNYWLNIALLRETQVLAHLGERASIRRSVQFFYLGLGLGKLMSEVRHAQFLAMEGCQLLEELEFYFASATVQSMKLMVATSTPTLHEPLHKAEDEALLTAVQEPFRPTLYKWNQRPVFRRLVTPSIPFPLDYREVMLSLCDILALVYSKLVEDNTCSENVFLFQAIVRFDEKIKKLVIDPVKKEFSAVAATVLVDELSGVRKAFSSGGGPRNPTQQPSGSAVLSPVGSAGETVGSASKSP